MLVPRLDKRLRAKLRIAACRQLSARISFWFNNAWNPRYFLPKDRRVVTRGCPSFSDMMFWRICAL